MIVMVRFLQLYGHENENELDDSDGNDYLHWLRNLDDGFDSDLVEYFVVSMDTLDILVWRNENLDYVDLRSIHS